MTSPQDLDHRVTNPIGLDALYEKVDETQKEVTQIASVQHLAGRAWREVGRNRQAPALGRYGGGRVLAAGVSDQPSPVHCGQLELLVDNRLAGCGSLARVAVMTAQRDLPSQVTMNKEEQDAMYDMQKQTHGWVSKIAATQRKHGQQLRSIEETLTGHSEMHASHSETLASHSKMHASHSETLASHGEKLDEILGILKAS